MYRRFFLFRILAAVLVIFLLFAASSAAFRMGYTQGWAQGALAQSAAQNGQAPNVAPGYSPGYGQGYAPGYPYSPGFFGPRFGFFPFFPFGLCLAGLFFLFLIGFLLRGPRRWGHAHGHPQGWGGPPWSKEPRQGEQANPEQEADLPQEEDRPME